MASTHSRVALQVGRLPVDRLPVGRLPVDRLPDHLLSRRPLDDLTSQPPPDTRTSWLTAPHARRARRNTRNPGGVADPVSWESW